MLDAICHFQELSTFAVRTSYGCTRRHQFFQHPARVQYRHLIFNGDFAHHDPCASNYGYEAVQRHACNRFANRRAAYVKKLAKRAFGPDGTRS
ncbi:hypothetical protein VARIO8X_110134 [Burkholderiales bacterium 8X]|nr:hypothetical protein VARIO8X_110134 [Burkholderiales bacterium 8X]